MFDCLPPDIPGVNENTIVYIINSNVEKIVPTEQVSESDRGFNIPVRDSEGNFTLKYVKTNVIKTVYFDKQGNEVPIEEAFNMRKVYCDREGNIIHRPLTMLFKSKE